MKEENFVYVDFPISKRIFDIIVSTIILIIASPLIFLIIVGMFLEQLIRPSTRGSLFYEETRYSEGKPFTFIKFRTFKKTAIERARNGNGIVHTKKLEQNMHSLTWMGMLLKQIYMDELPQLLNVLKGDMSLVGPRPTNKENIEKQIRKKMYSKLMIKAGLTGKFQSLKGYQLTKNQNEYDTEYALFVKENHALKIILCDLKILFASIKIVLRAEGI